MCGLANIIDCCERERGGEGIPKIVGAFTFHKSATTDMFYTTIKTTFSHVLMCFDIVHGRCKSIHH